MMNEVCSMQGKTMMKRFSFHASCRGKGLSSLLVCCSAWLAIVAPAAAQTGEEPAIKSLLGRPLGTVVKVRGRVFSDSEETGDAKGTTTWIAVGEVEGEAKPKVPLMPLLTGSAELRTKMAASELRWITVDCVEILRSNGAEVEHALLAIEPPTPFKVEVDDLPDRQHAIPSVLGVGYGIECYVEGEIVAPNPNAPSDPKRLRTDPQCRWIRVKKVNGQPKRILTELEITRTNPQSAEIAAQLKPGPVALIGYERLQMGGQETIPQECRPFVDWGRWSESLLQQGGWCIEREFVVSRVCEIGATDDQTPPCAFSPLIGQPFGTVCRVEARVVKTEYLWGRKEPGYFGCVLEIYSVAGQKLPKPVTIHAWPGWVDASPKEIEELKLRVGSTVMLVGYERAFMRGGPIGRVASSAEGQKGEDYKDTARWRIDRGFAILPWLSGKGGAPLVE